jgi:hypothetical protein
MCDAPYVDREYHVRVPGPLGCKIVVQAIPLRAEQIRGVDVAADGTLVFPPPIQTERIPLALKQQQILDEIE